MSPAPFDDSHRPLLVPSHIRSHSLVDEQEENPSDVELQTIFIADPSSPSADDRASPTMTRSRRQNHESSPAMNSSSSVEHRRKNPSLDNGGPSSAEQTEALLERSSFTLDEVHDPNKPASSSLLALSPHDQRNFALLVLLYFLQGVPMGLAMGSVPFLLKDNLSYGEIGVFTLASYPYSMKLLWSPIIDAIWSRRMGRRKSWIVPIQTVSAVMLIWLGANVDQMMKEANQKLYAFTFVFFILVMLCATQDIAVDGAGLPLLSLRVGADAMCRLGADATVAGESVVCVDRADCRTYCGPVFVLYGVFGV